MMRANKYNAKQSRRLWRLLELPLPWRDMAPGSDAFAHATKAYQDEHGLESDGMLGPKTLAAIGRCAHDAPGPILSQPVAAPNPAIPIAVIVAPDIDTDTYSATKTRKRSKPPQSIVLHDSITRTAKSCFRVLEKRDLSTHFLIDEDGTIYQCADPAARYTLHAAAWNRHSIGLDMINLLSTRHLKKNNRPENARRARVVKRDWSESRNGKVIDYTAPQKESLLALVRYLCAEFDIPYSAPAELTSYGERLPLDAKKHKGVVAHGQSSTKRWDGLLAVEYLHQDGAEQT